MIAEHILHVVHWSDRHCRSSHAAQKCLNTGEISSPRLPVKLEQRDVLDFYVTALLIGDNIFRFGLIECVSIAFGTSRRV